MKKNEISVPMPYKEEQIDKIKDINNQVIKSEITNMFFTLPMTCDLFTGFEGKRNLEIDKKDFGYWENIISYAINSGFDLIYLLNSPRMLMLDSPDFKDQLQKLDILLTKLKQIGCTKLRVTNPQLMFYLRNNYPDFTLYASTSLEYKTIKEYQNFLALHPTIKQIVPSHDINKNFKILKNLKKSFPELDIEIMLNEGCLGGCPQRLYHSAENLGVDINFNRDFYLSNTIYSKLCSKLLNSAPFLHICKASNIYPWEVKEYNKLGIYKFKLVGRDIDSQTKDMLIDSYLTYLKGIDNYKNIEEETFVSLIYHLFKYPHKYKIKDVKPYLPKIEHFKKKGHLCASVCGDECRYCYDCAEKLEKHLNKIYPTFNEKQKSIIKN